MTASLNLDPFDLWRKAVTRLESQMNTLGNRPLNSERFTKALHQFSAVSLQTQQMFDTMLEKILKAANIASHKDVTRLAETLQRIEDKLDQVLPAPARPARPRRTRQPSPESTRALQDGASTRPTPRRGTGSRRVRGV